MFTTCEHIRRNRNPLKNNFNCLPGPVVNLGVFPTTSSAFSSSWFARRMPDDAWQLAKFALGFGDRR